MPRDGRPGEVGDLGVSEGFRGAPSGSGERTQAGPGGRWRSWGILRRSTQLPERLSAGAAMQ